MKKLKRLLSFILVGALALAMLTACGGSSGSSTTTGQISYDSSRIAAATKQFEGGDSNIVVKTSVGGGAEITLSTHNGKTYYKSSSDDSTTAELEMDDTWFLVESTNGYGRYNIKIDPAYSFAVKLSESDESDLGYFTEVLVPTKESVMSITAGTMSFDGKEYYSETVINYISSEGIAFRETFLFDGNTLKYVLLEAEGIAVFEISAYTSAVDTALFELPENVVTLEEYISSIQD